MTQIDADLGARDEQTYSLIGAAMAAHSELCYSSVLVELKALLRLSGVEETQVNNHLETSAQTQAIPFNFGAPILQDKRLVSSQRKSASSADKF